MPYFKDLSGGLHFLEDTEHAYLLPEGCVLVTDDDAAIMQQSTSADVASTARIKRDELLAKADIAINVAEDAGQDTSALRKYRQALRDVPAQNGFPETINWPAV